MLKAVQLQSVACSLCSSRQRLPYRFVQRTLFSVNGIWDMKIKKATLKQIDDRWREELEKPSAYDVAAVTTSESSAASATKNPQQQKPIYVLCMFPYPSGKLHMGHVRVYTIGDVLARYHRLCGKQVINPIGWDAFGLPAENAAIERGLAADRWTYDNIENMKKQLKKLCYSFDWEREITTCDSSYYRWTQFIFLKMFEQGLAYCKEAPVNWDPVDQTVLADEQIDENQRSWRSGAKVVTKYLRQWYLRTTAFSESLLQGLDSLDPVACRSFANLQRHWIGKPSGCRLTFKLKDFSDGTEDLSIFCSTPELLYGVSFVMLSGSHPLALKTHLRDEHFRVLPGATAIAKLKVTAACPLTGAQLPVFVGSSAPPESEALDGYLGIPCIRPEDATVCNLYGLPKPRVIDDDVQPQRLINSGPLTNMDRDEAGRFVMTKAKEQGLGGHYCSSKLNDWLISRQRYWGTPIPVVHCPQCKVVPVPYEDLPVVLPPAAGHSGKGQLLSQITDWVKCKCPRCGGPASREVDTMDTFVDSSWYFLRYLDPQNTSELCSKALADRHMPIDIYVGGAEHACLHMYYARFVTHFLQSSGFLVHKEPFRCHLANGAVHSTSYKLKSTGKYLSIDQVDLSGPVPFDKVSGQEVIGTPEKMSKSKLNGVDPEEFLADHGVDLTRLYMLGHTAPDQIKQWSVQHAAKLTEPGGGKHSISFPKWLHQFWFTVGLLRKTSPPAAESSVRPSGSDARRLTDGELATLRNKVVRNVTYFTEHSFDLHLALSVLYKFSQQLDRQPLDVKLRSPTFHRCFADCIVMLHPYAPLVTAELWEGLRSATCVQALADRHWHLPITRQFWPIVDADFPLPLHLCVMMPAGELSSEAGKTSTAPCAATSDADVDTDDLAGQMSTPADGSGGVAVLASVTVPCHSLDGLDPASAERLLQSFPRIKQKLDQYIHMGDARLDIKKGHSARLVYYSAALRHPTA